MDRTDTITWVISVCASYLRLSQAKTLGNLVVAAMRCQRASLANLGRQMPGSSKHQIKRCWRFCANDRIETADAMRGIVKRLLKKRKKPLLIAIETAKARRTRSRSGRSAAVNPGLVWRVAARPRRVCHGTR